MFILLRGSKKETKKKKKKLQLNLGKRNVDHFMTVKRIVQTTCQIAISVTLI